jgi:hypothetical protein
MFHFTVPPTVVGGIIKFDNKCIQTIVQMNQQTQHQMYDGAISSRITSGSAGSCGGAANGGSGRCPPNKLVGAPYTMSPSCVYTASGEYVCGGGGDGSRTSFGGDGSRTSFGGDVSHTSFGGYGARTSFVGDAGSSTGGVPVSTSKPSSCSSFYHDTYDAMKSPSHPQRHFEEVWKNFNGQDEGLRPMAIGGSLAATEIIKYR